MIRKFNLSLWDLYTTFLSGILALIFVAAHVLVLNGFKVSNELLNLDARFVSLLLISIPIMFLVGMMVDALAIFVEDMDLKKVIPHMHEEANRGKLENYVSKKYIQKENPIDPYFMCKDYLEQQQLETPVMAFLGKFGFYRAAAFVFFLNAFITLYIYGIQYGTLLISALLFVVGSILMTRSAAFYRHTGRAVFTNYIVARMHEKK